MAVSGPVAELRDAFLRGAVRAAEHAPVALHAVADDPAATVAADGREGMDRALEAVERVSRSVDRDLKRLVVVVPANVANGHVRGLSPDMAAKPSSRPSRGSDPDCPDQTVAATAAS